MPEIKKKYFGYPTRVPYKTEDEWFQTHQDTAGMASFEDGSIVLNPYSKGEINFDAVATNEAVRLWLRENKIEPYFDLTKEQVDFFNTTEGYRDNPSAMKESILGRIISQDPSAGEFTIQQKKFADWVLKNIKQKEKD